MKLNAETYYSLQAEQQYLTNSQRKMYAECPASWKAKIDGDYIPSDSSAFLEGHYLDYALTEPAYVFNRWKEDNAHRLRGKYGQYKVFNELDRAIEIARKEPLMMKYLSGKSQVILVIDDFYGVPFKCRLDNINHELMFISDLKSTEGIRKPFWIEGEDGRNIRVPFYIAWGYWTQLALYRAAVHAVWEKWYDVYLVAMEKKPPFDRTVMDLTDESYLASLLQSAVATLREMQAIKEAGTIAEELPRCGKCHYCIETKLLTEPEKVFPPEVF